MPNWLHIGGNSTKCAGSVQNRDRSIGYRSNSRQINKFGVNYSNCRGTGLQLPLCRTPLVRFARPVLQSRALRVGRRAMPSLPGTMNGGNQATRTGVGLLAREISVSIICMPRRLPAGHSSTHVAVQLFNRDPAAFHGSSSSKDQADALHAREHKSRRGLSKAEMFELTHPGCRQNGYAEANWIGSSYKFTSSVVDSILLHSLGQTATANRSEFDSTFGIPARYQTLIQQHHCPVFGRCRN